MESQITFPFISWLSAVKLQSDPLAPLYAWDLNVETKGESSAAIRSDRGGGTMVVDGGTYTSNGVGSPAVW